MMKVIRILLASLILLATTSLLIAMEVGQEPAATDEVLYKCDFDTGLCGMTIEASPRTQFSWVRLSGPTPSDITGPDFDHTTNSMNGYYMYTEATDHYPGEITKLTIPSASISAPQTGSVLDACLTFWYNMYGYHIGDLNITVGNGEAIWSLSRNQSIGWKPMNVTLRHFLDTNPSTTGKGSVTFLGSRGGNDIGEPFGDIAIDDVIIYAGRCGEEETTTVEPTTTLTTTTTPTTMTTSTTTTPSTTTTTSTTTTPSTTTPSTTTTTPTTTTTTTTTPTTTTTTTTPGTTTSTIASTTTSTTMSTTTTKPPTPTPSTTTTISPTTTTQSTLMSSSPSVPSTTTTISTTTTLPSTTHSSTTKQTSTNSAVTTQTSAQTSTQTSDVTTTADRSMTSAVTSGTRPSNLDGSTQKAESQGGNLTENRVWGLSERDMIILVTILCVAILLLIILCIVLICCLCNVRRKYNVERTANLYPSSSTIDRVSTVEANPHGSRGGPGYVSPYDKTPSHHY